MSPPRGRKRLIHLWRPSSVDGVGVFSIKEGKETVFYTFAEIPCQIGGRGFVVHRLGLGHIYHVRVSSPEDSTCECLGFLRHGRCKHVLGLLALIDQGLL